MNQQNEGTPPDSRTGSTQATMETADGRIMPYQDTFQQPPPAATPSQPSLDVEQPVIGSVLQHFIGTDKYFEFIDFATTQTYRSVPLEEMDRMDLLAACGMLIGDYFSMQARLNAAQAPESLSAQQAANTMPPEVTAALQRQVMEAQFRQQRQQQQRQQQQNQPQNTAVPTATARHPGTLNSDQ